MHFKLLSLTRLIFGLYTTDQKLETIEYIVFYILLSWGNDKRAAISVEQ